MLLKLEVLCAVLAKREARPAVFLVVETLRLAGHSDTGQALDEGQSDPAIIWLFGHSSLGPGRLPRTCRVGNCKFFLRARDTGKPCLYPIAPLYTEDYLRIRESFS